MSYPALSVANYLLQLAEQDGQTIDPMKLQKLIYFCHGWSLATNGEPLIRDGIQAWRYGPVVPSVYAQFKKFGNEPITEMATRYATPIRFNKEPYPNPRNQADRELIEAVWKGYGRSTAIQLSNLTHEPGSPWHQVAGDDLPDSNRPIPDELIREYFVRQLQEVDPPAAQQEG